MIAATWAGHAKEQLVDLIRDTGNAKERKFADDVAKNPWSIGAMTGSVDNRSGAMFRRELVELNRDDAAKRCQGKMSPGQDEAVSLKLMGRRR